MKILVTGGCGFIGSHVVDAYVEKGYEVTVVDNLSTGKKENLNQKARLYITDIGSEEMKEIFYKEKPDVVNHHAAQISVPLSVKDALYDAEINIKGTIRLLELSREYAIQRFIFSSTGGAIYGEATEIPTEETYYPRPASPYAISKFAAEKYILFYHDYYRIPCVILRYSNVYGPRQVPHGEAGVVAIFTEKLLQEEHAMLYHFPEEPLGMIRDYCSVTDVAQANLMATEKKLAGIFNIGTGIGTRTYDLYKTILNIVREKGKALNESFDEPLRGIARPGDIHTSTLNVRKAMDVLGWKALKDLKTGISETITWYMKNET